jgi:hypothetical protein
MNKALHKNSVATIPTPVASNNLENREAMQKPYRSEKPRQTKRPIPHPFSWANFHGLKTERLDGARIFPTNERRPLSAVTLCLAQGKRMKNPRWVSLIQGAQASCEWRRAFPCAGQSPNGRDARSPWAEPRNLNHFSCVCPGLAPGLLAENPKPATLLAMNRCLGFLILLTMGMLPSVQGASMSPADFATAKDRVAFGAYIDFGETEDLVTLEGIEAFEKLAGRSPAIIASSSYWGKQCFPAKNVALISRHGATPMVFWSPWDKPYEENKGPDRFSLTAILAGKWDKYIDAWADAAKAFGKPLFVSFGNEMNGDWFPWSGWFYGGARGGGNEVFKRAWRYVVDRVRARGATNILWVFQVNNYPASHYDWNTMKAYYPGPDYVDWLGLSVYGKQFRNTGNWADFLGLLDWPYKEITALDPNKPVMLAEFGVGSFFVKAHKKAQWLSDAFSLIPKYPRIKAAVYWHERWQNEDGTYSNLRINSSPAALAAFQKGLEDPHWIALKPKTP